MRTPTCTRALAARAPLGVVDQVRVALRPKNRLAALLGAILGGFVPIASYVLAHHEIAPGTAWALQPAPWLVAGGLVYSAKTVFDWARAAFALRAKALGFVVLLEGVMTGSATRALALAALVILVGINAVSAGCQLSLARRS